MESMGNGLSPVEVKLPPSPEVFFLENTEESPVL